MNKNLIRISASIICVFVLLGSFFTYSFLSNRARVISTANVELKDELIKLKQQENNVKSEKAKLDNQYKELQQKLNKLAK